MNPAELGIYKHRQNSRITRSDINTSPIREKVEFLTSSKGDLMFKDSKPNTLDLANVNLTESRIE